MGPMGINIGIYDISDGNERLLYWSPSILKSSSVNSQIPKDTWSRAHDFKIGNRNWKIIANSTPAFFQFYHRWGHWEVLVLVNRRLLVEQEVQERVEELATTNQLLKQEVLERKKMEEEFMHNERYLQRRHEAVEYLTKFTVSELKHGINEVLLRTASVMRIDRVGVWFYENENDEQKLSCAGLYVLTTNVFMSHLELTSNYFPHYFEALLSHSQLIIPSTNNEKLNQELSSYLAAFHIISKLDIPIVFEDKLSGVLVLEETRAHRDWTLEDRHFGQTIAEIIAIMIEQSGRRKAEKALQESQERVRFITQKAIDAIISVSDKQEITSWNYGAEVMFGYNEKEMLGKPLHMVIPEADFFQKATSSKPIELKGFHQDKHAFPVEASHTRWKSGDIYFDTIIIRDITERKNNEKRLIKAMQEAKAANEAKTEFLATVSHELRTPLNAIIGFNQCLLMGMDGVINDSQRASLIKIEKSAFNLLHLINDILDLAKIEANRTEVEIGSYNIVELVVSCFEEVHSMIMQKNIQLYLSVDKPLILVDFDKAKIRQVLLNLLSNAVKFTEKGEIDVTVLDGSHQVEIQVKDTGIGLSEEEIAKLFKPFSQADSSITRKYGGTGLGLAISKKIVDLHEGSLKVKSVKGEGSTFIFTLPKTGNKEIE
jgi:PAS domain S-box-containing protein